MPNSSRKELNTYISVHIIDTSAYVPRDIYLYRLRLKSHKHLIN